jgi:hypothetical protein
MAIKYIIVLFVETPRKFVTAVINLRGVSTNKTIIIYEYFRHCPRSVSLFTTLNHRFSRVHTMAAFQVTTSATSNWVHDQQNSSQP